MKYEIDSDTAEGITKNVLCEEIKLAKRAIKQCKKNRAHDDLADVEKYLNALEIVYDYFGGTL